MEQNELQGEREERIKERDSRTLAEVHRQHIEYMEELERKALDGFIDLRKNKQPSAKETDFSAIIRGQQ